MKRHASEPSEPHLKTLATADRVPKRPTVATDCNDHFQGGDRSGSTGVGIGEGNHQGLRHLAWAQTEQQQGDATMKSVESKIFTAADMGTGRWKNRWRVS